MWLQTEEVKLFVKIEGNGPQKMVLLHGTTGRSDSFNPILPHLATAFQLHIPDLRGHGQSSHVAHGYRVLDFSRDIIALIEHRGSTPVILVGHSLGGLVALAVAAARPDLVGGLVIEDPPLWLRRNTVKAGSQRAYTFFKTLHTILSTTRDADAIRQQLKQQAPDALAREQDSLAERLSQLDPDVLRMSFDSTLMEGWDIDATFSAIQCPALILQADPAEGGSLQDMDVLAALSKMPNASHRYVSAAGHHIHRDKPALMAKIMTQWLREGSHKGS